MEYPPENENGDNQEVGGEPLHEFLVAQVSNIRSMIERFDGNQEADQYLIRGSSQLEQARATEYVDSMLAYMKSAYHLFHKAKETADDDDIRMEIETTLLFELWTFIQDYEPMFEDGRGEESDEVNRVVVEPVD